MKFQDQQNESGAREGTFGGGGLDWEEDRKELSGVWDVGNIRILTWVVVTQVYAHVKLHSPVRLKRTPFIL